MHLVPRTPSLSQVDVKFKINCVNCTTMCDARRVWAVSVQRYLGSEVVVNLSRHTTKKMLFKDNWNSLLFKIINCIFWNPSRAKKLRPEAPTSSTSPLSRLWIWDTTQRSHNHRIIYVGYWGVFFSWRWGLDLRSKVDLVVESGMHVLTSRTNAAVPKATQLCSPYFDKEDYLVCGSGSPFLCKYICI